METAETDSAQKGAVKELAADPASRKRFFKMMGGAGAASAFAIFLAACGDDDKDATATTSKTKSTAGTNAADLAIVQYALTLEHLETDFYNAVIDSGVVKTKGLGDVAKMIRDNEQEHVDALTRTVGQLGGTPKRPKTNFDAVIEGRREEGAGDGRRGGEPRRRRLPRTGPADHVHARSWPPPWPSTASRGGTPPL